MKILECSALYFSSCIAIPLLEKPINGGPLSPFCNCQPYHHQPVSWVFRWFYGPFCYHRRGFVSFSSGVQPYILPSLKNHCQVYWQVREILTLLFQKLILFLLPPPPSFLFLSLERITSMSLGSSKGHTVFNLPNHLLVCFCICSFNICSWSLMIFFFYHFQCSLTNTHGVCASC